MKKYLKIFTVLVFLFSLFGCSDESESMMLQKEKLLSEISGLKDEIAELQEAKKAAKLEVSNLKEENGTAKYVVTFKIKQTHVSLSISKHIKDALNEITIEIPVDKEYYESLSVGDVISDEFRIGSFVARGSFGNWKITVENKEIV